MSCLKLYSPQRLSLYWPTEADSRSTSDGTAPVILRFPHVARRTPAVNAELLNRARVIYQNHCCPECQRATVQITDDSELVSAGSHMPVPGTSQVVGFRCTHCEHAWDA